MLIFAMVLLRNLLNPMSLLEEIEGTLIQPLPRSMLPPILICLVVTGVLAIFSLLNNAPLVSWLLISSFMPARLFIEV